MLLPLLGCSDSEGEGPEGSVNLAPTVVVRGSYLSQQNDCPNDGSDLTIVQDFTTLFFSGGFDFQSASPDAFEGYLDEDELIRFSIEGSSETVCTASFASDILTGTCATPGSGCAFTFVKKPAEESTSD